MRDYISNLSSIILIVITICLIFTLSEECVYILYINYLFILITF
jgi:hypothetical protein